MKFRQTLFWDVDPSKIDTKKHAQYIIERIFDYGTDKEVKWVWNFYDRDFVVGIVKKSRCLMPQTKNLWLLTVINK